MIEETWTAVDSFLTSLVVRPDRALDETLAASRAAGLPEIAVSPPQGKLLHLLARLQNAEHILEIGTLAGYSAIWLARGLRPGGRLVTLEFEPKHAELARKNIQRAGLGETVEIRVGRAIDTLAELAAEGRPPFDLVFIDADKPSMLEYFEGALRLTRPGSLIVVDNVVREGKVLDATSADASIQGVRRFLEAAAVEPRVSLTALQTVGAKGYDGLAVALVTSS
jgi:predicted O-methyltransferase YrrM